MAIYTFQCEKCNHIFTAQQSMEEHAKHHDPKCPKCGHDKVLHRLSHVNVKTARKS